MSEPIPRVILSKHNLGVKPSHSLQLYIGLHAVARDSTLMFRVVRQTSSEPKRKFQLRLISD